MYANFTEETATGTGDVLTLTGASSGNIPFSASFDDGDLVAYVAEDSSGNKVAGIGVYNAGTITRNDTWSYDGASVDKKPIQNIALSGDVVVRCSETQATSEPLSPAYGFNNGSSGLLTSANRIDEVTIPANQMLLHRFDIQSPFKVDALGSFQIRTAGTSPSKLRVAIYTSYKSKNSSFFVPDKLMADSGDIDASTTGYRKENTLSTPVYLPRGVYLAALVSDDNIGLSGFNNQRGLLDYLLLGTSSTVTVLGLKYSLEPNWDSLPASMPLDESEYAIETYQTPNAKVLGEFL